jgi:hypothetical protein
MNALISFTVQIERVPDIDDFQAAIAAFLEASSQSRTDR